MSNEIIIKKNESILEITINRPKVNVINSKISRQLAETFLKFNEDPTLRVAIITASGKQIFSAGWDLKANEAIDEDHGPGGFAGLTELYNLKKPVIAAVNGKAIGGGFELALACDLIVASNQATFHLPEVQLGIVPDSGGAIRLPKRIPRNIALEMLFTGKELTAKRAFHLGLINHIVPFDSLMETAREVAKEIVQAAPLPIAAIKEIVYATDGLRTEEGFHWMRNNSDVYQKMLTSEDAREGQLAFTEKRTPHWQGK